VTPDERRELTALEQQKDLMEGRLNVCRAAVSRAQKDYARARKEHRQAQLAYVEFFERVNPPRKF
jgi:hypothetical protein